MLALTVERMAFIFKDQLNVYKVNIDEESGLAERSDAIAVPVLLFFREGCEQYRAGGIIPPSRLFEKFEELVREVKDQSGRQERIP